MKKHFKEIYKDDDIIVVSKSAGLLSIPDRYDPNKINLKSLLQMKYGSVFAVHRIDKNTSGIIVYALNEYAHQQLSISFEKRLVKKIYAALVEGFPPDDTGTIDKAILITENKQKVSIHSRGKRAISNYKLSKKYQHYSLLEVSIETGRRHQIRAHLSYLGMPIVGDGVYGRSNEFYLSDLKGRKYNLKKNEFEKPLVNRQLLHAQKLSIQHPRTRKEMQFVADFPKDFRAMLNQLEKWDGRMSD